MIRTILLSAGILAMILGSTTSVAEQKLIMPRGFEATATVEHVDPIAGYMIMNGKKYLLADTLRVSGIQGGRQQLKAGQVVSYQVDSQRAAPVITDIMVMEPNAH